MLEDKVVLVSHCENFCQTMASISSSFSFSLIIDDSFSFFLDISGKETLMPQRKKKKKKTPSAMRRDARKKISFLQKKLEVSTDEPVEEDHEKDVNTM